MTFINYSSPLQMDLVWTEKFFLRRVTLMTLLDWSFMLHVDSSQPWCLPSKASLRIGRVSLSLMFHETWWLPEIDVFICLSRRYKHCRIGIYWRRWKNNMLSMLRRL
jgi:hypothetical protein